MIRQACLGLLAIVAVGMSAAPAVARGDEPKKKVDTSLAIRTEMSIAAVALFSDESRRDEVVAWFKPVFPAVEALLADDARPRTLVVQVTLHPDREAEMVVAGRPEVSEEERSAIRKVADPARLPRSRIVDCVLEVVAKVNGGAPDEKEPLVPALTYPHERRMAALKAAPTAEKVAIIRRWARTEAIPLIAKMASDADPKFEGVRNLGRALSKIKPDDPIDVAGLTDKNPDFWRAMLEMVPGLPLIPASRLALHAANGEIDAARRVAQLFAPFDGHRSGYSALIGEFRAMADVFYRDVEGRIQKGIALHDAGKFDEALAAYQAILKDYPGSAWALYERHQTRLMLANKGGNAAQPDWRATRREILAADSMYGAMAQASSASELYDLLLRRESLELFRDPAKSVPDLLRYADIALDVGQPGIAAMIFWSVLTSVKPADYKNRALLEDVLYCFEKLGATSLKDNFRGDHAAAFKRIDAEREKRRSESPVTRTMKDQGE